MIPDIGDYGGHVIRRSNDALRRCMTYVKDLDDSQALSSAELRRIVVAHILDLFAVVLKPRPLWRLAVAAAPIRVGATATLGIRRSRVTEERRTLIGSRPAQKQRSRRIDPLRK